MNWIGNLLSVSHMKSDRNLVCGNGDFGNISSVMRRICIVILIMFITTRSNMGW